MVFKIAQFTILWAAACCFLYSNLPCVVAAKQECTKSSITYGKLKGNDILVNVSYIQTPGKLLRSSSIMMKYPQDDSKRKMVLSYVDIQNRDTKCNCWKNKVHLSEGGPGYKYVVLSFNSQTNCKMDYYVKLFVS